MAVLALAGALFGIVTSPPAAAQSRGVDLLLLEPTRGKPLFGPNEAVIELVGDFPIDQVEVELDGEIVAEKTAPPWRIPFHAGDDNRDHQLVVRALLRGRLVAETVADFPAFQVNSEIDAKLRPVYVTASRQGGRLLDLEAKDFTLYAGNERQEIVTFARGDVEIAASILVDASSSMAGRRLRFAVSGASTFVEGLDGEHDEAAVRLFSDRLLFRSPFDPSPERVLSGLERVDPVGGTALADHLYLGLKELEERRGRRVLLLLSDGVDTHSAVDLGDVAWLARRSRAQLYWIRTDPREQETSRFSSWKNADTYRNEWNLLHKMVRDSGGRVITLNRIEETAGAVREILQELREQYVLGFNPPDGPGDGRWQRLTVRVSRPGVDLRYREGYISD
ncbi:MAG: VWA domain-containing protein [Acidobacteriota bacterium]